MDEVWSRINAELTRREKTWAWLATAMGMTDQRVNNWRRRRVPPEMYEDIARALRWSIDQLLSDKPTSPVNHPSGGSNTVPVAQKLSHYPARITPTTISWESLVSSVLPERFSVVVPDDSMAPLRAGHLAIFATNATAKGGDVVLLRDQAGETYIRTYIARRPGHWLAEARVAGWAPLDSIADGLQVMAVLVGHEWG